MLEKMNAINQIQEIKASLADNEYSSSNLLQKDFYGISHHLWEDINLNNIQQSDLTDVSNVHNFLIEEILEIHKSERDIKNEMLFDSTLLINPIKEQLNDGKRGKDIYFFSDESCTYYFIGDIHSDLTSLKRILEVCDFFHSVLDGGNTRLIFLGDYVDRGKKHLETIEALLLLKYLFPDNIYLLRGNHDGGRLENGVMNLVIGRDPKSEDEAYFCLYTYNLAKVNGTFKMYTVENYLRFFNSLSNLALFGFSDLTLMTVHGGIPRPKMDSEKIYCHIKNIGDLSNDQLFDHNGMSIIHNMLWSDPCEVIEEENRARKRFKFSRDDFEEFSNILGIDKLIRGHQAEVEGYKEFYEGRLFTIFSSGQVLNNHNENINDVTAYGKVRPCIIKKVSGKDIVVIDINKEISERFNK